MVISLRFVPQGLEDATLHAKKDFIVALWKQENQIHICFGGKVCVHPITDEDLEVEITVYTSELKVTIDGQEKDSTSITPALTETALTEIIKSRNMPMFYHVANYVNYVGQRLLRTACEFGPANCVDFVLEKSQIDADSWYNPLDPDSFTPLFSAAANGHDDIVKLLVEKFHTDVNKGKMLFPGQCALSYAILNNHIRTVKTLVQLGAVNPKAGVAMKILQGWKDDHPVYVPRASLMLNVDHHNVIIERR